MSKFRSIAAIATLMGLFAGQNASAQPFIFNDGQNAESCFTSNKPYNWIIYKTVPDNSCPTQRPSYRYYMANTTIYPSGTVLFTCSLWGISGWSIVSTYTSHPLCQGISGAAEIRKN